MSIFLWGLIFFVWPLDSTNENQAYKRTVYLLEDHKVTLISDIFFMRIIFFPPWHRDSNQREDLEAYSTYIPVLLHQVCTYHQVLRCWVTMHAQLRSVRLYIAQQRSVAPCGAVRSRTVRCRALRCDAVSCCAVCFLSNIEQYTGYNTYCCVLLFFFLFLHAFDLSRLPVVSPRKLPPYCRSERNTGNKSTQHSWAQQSNLLWAALGIIKSLFAPNHGSLLSAPFTCFWLHSSLPCASVAGGVSRPRSGALVRTYFEVHIYTRYFALYAFQWLSRTDIFGCLMPTSHFARSTGIRVLLCRTFGACLTFRLSTIGFCLAY